jgi:hypothetical protein
MPAGFVAALGIAVHDGALRPSVATAELAACHRPPGDCADRKSQHEAYRDQQVKDFHVAHAPEGIDTTLISQKSRVRVLTQIKPAARTCGKSAGFSAIRRLRRG